MYVTKCAIKLVLVLIITSSSFFSRALHLRLLVCLIPKFHLGMQFRLLLFLVLFSGWMPVSADVVKPALIEINVESDGNVAIEIRASIEALLTGINGKYKNTQNAPNADKYDALRVLNSEELAQHFQPFKQKFLASIALTTSSKKRVPLAISKVTIPERGYTKVPRISVIHLTAKIDTAITSLQWYYPLAFGDNAVRLRQINQAEQQWHWSEWQWLRKDNPSTPFSLTEIVSKRPIYQVIAEYIVIGFEHIIPKGMDHILFILALFFFSTRIKPLLWQITMFTVAHTITLGLAMNGIVNLPAQIVEPLIALSIAYAGFENIVAKNTDTAHRSRLMLVFAFGLLHGMGFASVLSDFGMPDDAFVTALISFNVGVEIGQLAVVALAFVMFTWWFGKKSWYRHAVVIPVSALIALTGLWWTIERIQL